MDRIQLTPLPFIDWAECHLPDDELQVLYATDAIYSRDISTIVERANADHAGSIAKDLIDRGVLHYDAKEVRRPEYHALKAFKVTG